MRIRVLVRLPDPEHEHASLTVGSAATVEGPRGPVEGRLVAAKVARPPRHPRARGDYLDAVVEVPDGSIDRTPEVEDLERRLSAAEAEKDRLTALVRLARESGEESARSVRVLAGRLRTADGLLEDLGKLARDGKVPELIERAKADR